MSEVSESGTEPARTLRRRRLSWREKVALVRALVREMGKRG